MRSRCAWTMSSCSITKRFTWGLAGGTDEDDEDDEDDEIGETSHGTDVKDWTVCEGDEAVV